MVIAIKSVVMKLAKHVASMGNVRTAYISIRKLGGTRPIGRPRRRWENTIKVDLREIAWVGVDLIHLTQDKFRDLVSTGICLHVL
jgi:hypothetical protein